VREALPQAPRDVIESEDSSAAGSIGLGGLQPQSKGPVQPARCLESLLYALDFAGL
jgi:hypothetical protein